jgi:hypothetical protein
MFSVNSYARIKGIIEVKDKYTVGKISISQKNKTTNQYEADFIGVIKFVGNAHLQKPMEGQRIKILSCGVSNCYTKDNAIEFTKNPTYVIFGYELQDSNGVSNTAQSNIPTVEVNSDELPF